MRPSALTKILTARSFIRCETLSTNVRVVCASAARSRCNTKTAPDNSARGQETKPKWMSKHVLLPRIGDCCHHSFRTGDPAGRARVATRDRGLSARAQNASREGLDDVGQGGRTTDRGERSTRGARVAA